MSTRHGLPVLRPAPLACRAPARAATAPSRHTEERNGEPNHWPATAELIARAEYALEESRHLVIAAREFQCAKFLAHEKFSGWFTMWLTFQRERQDATGEFARFVAHDRGWPARANMRALIDYLKLANAPLIPHLEKAWQEVYGTEVWRAPPLLPEALPL